MISVFSACEVLCAFPSACGIAGMGWGKGGGRVGKGGGRRVKRGENHMYCTVPGGLERLKWRVGHKDHGAGSAYRVKGAKSLFLLLLVLDRRIPCKSQVRLQGNQITAYCCPDLSTHGAALVPVCLQSCLWLLLSKGGIPALCRA